MADVADNGLATGMDVDVLHGDLLLTLAAMAVERFEERGVCARKLVGLA